MLAIDFEERIRAAPWGQPGGNKPIADVFMGMLSASNDEAMACRSWLEQHLVPQTALDASVMIAIPFLIEMVAAKEALIVVYDLLRVLGISSEISLWDPSALANKYLRELASSVRDSLAKGAPYFQRDFCNKRLPDRCRIDALSLLSASLPDGACMPLVEIVCKQETDADLAREFMWVAEDGFR